MSEDKIKAVTDEILYNKEKILEEFDRESLEVYDFIQKRFRESNGRIGKDRLFKFVFRSFYRLDNAGLGADLKKKYFELLESKENDLNKILSILRGIETARRKNTVQFSFATKLLHTLDDKKPIFDSKINRVIKLKYTSKDIDSCAKAYKKLEEITEALLKKDEIMSVINEFKKRHEKEVSDHKALDFILWTLGKMKNKQKVKRR
jgi:hypothetical protein